MAAPSFAGLQPWAIPYAQYLYQVAEYNGLRPRITSVFRTYQQQAVLYQRYLRGMSSLPAAPPGRSLHERGLAFDMVTDYPEALGAVWNSMGGRWFAADPVHHEIPG
jgi:LAS superfamily LD-carboxypeptidase LdcB